MDKIRKNIFISHYGGDEKYIEPFKKQVGSGINVYDSSIVETEPNRANNEHYIKYNILAPKIDWAGTVVVLIGPETKNRNYVNWEIEYAVRHDKRLVGVYLPNATADDIPESLKKYGDSLVTWDKNKMINALSGGTEWQTPSGGRRQVSITRGTC